VRTTIIAVGAFALMLFFAGAEDAGAITLGSLQVNPYLKFNTAYDDNVFVQNGDNITDWYFDVSPGLRLQLGKPERNMLALEYWADVYRYVDTGGVNDVEDHTVKAQAYFKFPGGLSLKLDDQGQRGHVKRSDANLAVTGVTPLNRFWSNDLRFEVAYELSERFKAAVAYKSYYVAYSLDAAKFEDVNINGAVATVYYKFMPKTSLLVQGTYNRVYHFQDVAETPLLNSNEYWAMAGLTWDITEKSTGTIKGGYEWKNFDNPQTHDFQSAVYEVSLDHRFTPKTAITVSGRRLASETNDPNVPYYTTTNGAVELRYRPVVKTTFRPFFSYSREKYAGLVTVGPNSARRTDGVLTTGIEAAYDMNKWFSFGVTYTHSKRSSNLTFYDYTDNMVMIMLKASV
jgi:predicted porin